MEDNDNRSILNKMMGLGSTLGGAGLAGYYAYTKIKSNSPVSDLISTGSLPQNGVLKDAGKALGQSIKKDVFAERAKAQTQGKKLVEDLMQADGIQKILSKTNEYNALVQTMINTMDSSGMEMPQETLRSFRNSMDNILANDLSPEETKKILSDALSAMHQYASPETMRTFGREMQENRKIASQLTKPRTTITRDSPYVVVDGESLSKKANARFGRLKKTLADQGLMDGQVEFEFLKSNEQTYLRVYQPGFNNGRNFLETLPLDLGRGKNGVWSLKTGEHLSTGYTVGGFLNAKRFIDHKDKIKDYQTAVQYAGSSVEDSYIYEFGKRIVKNKMIDQSAKRGFREWRGAFQQSQNRFAHAGFKFSQLSGLSSHLDTVAQAASNNMNIVGLDAIRKPEDREDFMKRLSVIKGFNPSSPDNMMVKTPYGYVGHMGRMQNSVLSGLSKHLPFKANRTAFPVLSRVEQISGRDAMIVADPKVRQTAGGVFTLGGLTRWGKHGFSRIGSNADVADETVSGGANRVFLIHSNQRGKKWEMEGAGLAFGSGKMDVLDTFTKPLLDTKSHRSMTTPLMEAIISSTNSGSMLDLTNEQVKAYGGFLGFGPNGKQYLKDDPRTLGYSMAAYHTEAYGKQQVNVEVVRKRRMDRLKIFSHASKGTTEQISREMSAEYAGYANPVLQSAGIDLDDVLHVTPDMHKKGYGFVAKQLTTAYGALSGDVNYLSAIKSGMSSNGNEFAETVKSIINLAGRTNMSSEKAGLMLGLVAGPSADDYLQTKRTGLDLAGVQSMIRSSFGSRADEVLKYASEGISLQVATVTQGAGQGDWGRGRSSMEQRSYWYAQRRLQMMGMDANESAGVLSSIYKRKVGVAETIMSTNALEAMNKSMHGQTNIGDFVDQGNLPKYSLKDLVAMTTGQEKVAGFISRHPEGFMMDLNGDPQSLMQERIASQARKVFGDQPVYFAGANAQAAMKGTQIKQEGKSLQIDDQYARDTEHFFENLQKYSVDPSLPEENMLSTMQNYKGSISSLHTAFRGKILGGKHKGMVSSVASTYLLDNGTGMTPAQSNAALALWKKSKGQAFFMDHYAFSATLSDFMGESKGRGDKDNAVDMVRRFYGSTARGNTHKAKGVAAMVGRHPMMGLGNIAFGAVYRDVKELDGPDIAFNSFAASEKGRSVLAGMPKIKGFADVENLQAKYQTAFWNNFTGHLINTAAEGGGTVMFPKRTASINYNGKSINMDMGFLQEAFGDVDGDQMNVSFFDSKSAKAIRSKMTGSGAQSWQQDAMRYKAVNAIIGEEAKAGLKSAMGELLPEEQQIMEDAMKEYATQAKTGKVDIQLTQLRQSLLNVRAGTAESRQQVDAAIALLGNIQEHVLLKSKKLPRYMPYADMLTRAVEEMHSGRSEAMKGFLETTVFRGSQMLGGGVTIDNIQSGIPSIDTASQGIAGMNLNLGTLIDTMQNAHNQSVRDNIHTMVSPGQINKMLEDGQVSEAFATMAAGEDMAGAVLNAAGNKSANIGSGMSAAKHMTQRVGNALSTMDSKYMGMAAAGIIGAAAVGSAVMQGEHSPQNMYLPEPPKIQDPPPVNMSDSGGADVYATAGRVLNTPSTYLPASNSYSIRGQLTNLASAGAMGNYLSNASRGNLAGSLRINDSRRPITSNYLDRLTGE